MQHEIRRNAERYRFLRWSSAALPTVHINPPGTGIMHTINLEQLATVVATQETDDGAWIYPDMRSEEHTSELQSLIRISYAVLRLKNNITQHIIYITKYYNIKAQA